MTAALLAHIEARHPGDRTTALLRKADGRPLDLSGVSNLWKRIRTHLRWVQDFGVSAHRLRHTTFTWVERRYGYATAQTFAGHVKPTAASGTTLVYTKADIHEVADVLAAYTGEPHPLSTTNPPSDSGRQSTPLPALTTTRLLRRTVNAHGFFTLARHDFDVGKLYTGYDVIIDVGSDQFRIHLPDGRTTVAARDGLTPTWGSASSPATLPPSDRHLRVRRGANQDGRLQIDHQYVTLGRKFARQSFWVQVHADHFLIELPDTMTMHVARRPEHKPRPVIVKPSNPDRFASTRKASPRGMGTLSA